MASNYRQPGNTIDITGPTGGLTSGQPYALGKISLVALTDIAEGAVGSAAKRGVFSLSVQGVDGSGNSAVALGDQLYYTSTDTPPLAKKATGVPYGKALGTVPTGATATIDVLLDE
jgi:predicted RecA/RadA family phage recombinase